MTRNTRDKKLVEHVKRPDVRSIKVIWQKTTRVLIAFSSNKHYKRLETKCDVISSMNITHSDRQRKKSSC